MEITTKQILKALHVISWIIFIGLCVEACAYIFNTFSVVVLNPEKATNFWDGINFAPLYNSDAGQFMVVATFMIIVAVMKAIMFYLIIRILQDKKLNMMQPFSQEVGSFIFHLSYLSLVIGIFSRWAYTYMQWLTKQFSIILPDIQTLNLEGGSIWLFMAVILFVIAHIFKRGIEIQAENELTV